MRRSNMHPVSALIGIILSAAAMAAPVQAQAAARGPGTCNLGQVMACSPGSLLDALAALFRV